MTFLLWFQIMTTTWLKNWTSKLMTNSSFKAFIYLFFSLRNRKCADAHSFCGIKDKKYPDKRTMGYPFDRVIKNKNSLADFTKAYSNMISGEITIKFSDVIVPK